MHISTELGHPNPNPNPDPDPNPNPNANQVRISAELGSPSNRPLKDLPGVVDAEERGAREAHLDDEMRDEVRSRPREMAEVDGGAAEAEGLLRTHLNDLRFELYVPPLTTTLLNATYEQSAERTGREAAR